MMRSQFVCLLLVLLSATVLSQDSIQRRYAKFRNQHICENIGAKSCDDVIRQRRITKTNSNACKESNTFIIAKTKAVKAVCKDKGEQYGNMTKSIQKFKILTCKLKNRSASSLSLVTVTVFVIQD
ncbi:ribonuclease-like 3 [Lates japonicus]|uniref:Ribonuclease-like 3 n=1 Tax=Lates japonicus TaxID=270547 RepID=A0AAD3NDN2_LATJO|nr:ribonuclease-like 3 [Lates japonicus]